MRLVAAVIVVGCAAVACGGGPTTLTIRGTVTVNGNLFVTDQTTGGPWFTDGLNAACGANPPQQLTVEDGSHAVLGSAILALGHMDGTGNCHIKFTIRNVQARKPEYGFSIPGAGTTWVSGAQVTRPVLLTLG